MIREKAEVISTKGKYAKVKMTPGSDCDGCTICKHGKPFQMNVFNEVNAAVGDMVIISIDNMPRMFTVIMYISPIISMIVGYFLGMAIFKSEDLSILSSFVFLIVHGAVALVISKKKKYRAFIVNKCEDDINTSDV